MVEEGAAPPIGGEGRKRARGRMFALEDLKTSDAHPPRRATGIAEFDRVCGGGVVPGSALLVGGDPGIGKSTLILQALAEYAKAGGRAVYISGEEAMAQVRLRAARMELADAPGGAGLGDLRGGHPLDAGERTAARHRRHRFHPDDLDLGIGSGARNHRAGAHPRRSTWCAMPSRRGPRSSSSATSPRNGQIAGPKAVEHLVDAVLYFEGERGHHFRLLRAVKNRFGRPTRSACSR